MPLGILLPLFLAHPMRMSCLISREATIHTAVGKPLYGLKGFSFGLAKIHPPKGLVDALVDATPVDFPLDFGGVLSCSAMGHSQHGVLEMSVEQKKVERTRSLLAKEQIGVHCVKVSGMPDRSQK
ncbi:hypothetical protein JB92DRAFT_2828017 [Gautieria morchelliformis]|nr:hypothetical protein JB92DRAFT_2828017 [Gautieria morchelliformis]